VKLDADGFAEISLGEEGWERTESATDIFVAELDEKW